MPESFCPLCHSVFASGSSGFCSNDGSQLRPIEELGANWIGKVIHDKYRITRYVGAGGMAEVYEAEHVALSRTVAIKLLHARFTSDPIIVERFKQEARLVSVIAHPNVVTVEDFGTLADGTLYMVMELLRGKSLEEALEEGEIDPTFAIDIAMQACEGLQAAHDKNIIHRDIKPGNIFLHRACDAATCAEVNVKVLDLGVARLVGEDAKSNLTVTGTVFGTPEYMSPQQAMGSELDFRSDIYSMGVVVYHMLVGTVPFSASSFLGVLTKHLTESPTWPAKVARERGLPVEAEEVVMKALRKNPDHRYGSIRELRDALSGLRPQVVASLSVRPSATPGSASPSVVPSRPASASIHRVPLGIARGSDQEVVEIAPDIFWVGRRQGGLLECNSYLRVYRGNGTQLAVLIDPGPHRDLEVISSKVSSVLGSLDKIDILFLNHQDPDVCSNAPTIQQYNPRTHVLCSEDTWRLVQFYGLRQQGFSAIEHFRDQTALLSTGHRVSFVPTPYCHFRGAVMYYDHETRVLFSGDLFGGLSRNRNLVATPDDLADVEIFHQLYMPSSKALQLAVERIRRLDPKPRLIAPQHGGLVVEERIEPMLHRFEALQVGVDLLVTGKERDRFVKAANELVQGFVGLFGESHVAALLRQFASDGSFPNLFVLSGELGITDIKIEPGAALRALVRDVSSSAPPAQLRAIERVVDETLGRHGVSLAVAPEDRFGARHFVIDVEE
ncbi:MAG: protein kinase [Deltaproteobacteria bacterium]|nr:protein kinase [Deltaproteobacteria bacterium]